MEFLSWPTLSAFVLLAIYETVVATLALTHMVPQEDLTCPLERRWGQLYSARDAEAIRRIQDTHQCCGLVTTKDKAWPFQGIDHPSDACVKAFDRHKSCLGVWRQDEQIFAGLLLLVALTTFILKVCNPYSRKSFLGRDRFTTYGVYKINMSFNNTWVQFLILLRLVSERPDSWIHHIVGSRYPALTAGGQDRLEAGSSNEHTNGISRRIEAAYSDDAVEDADEEQTVPQLAETSANRGGDTESRRNNQGLVVQPSRLIDDRNEWANE